MRRNWILKSFSLILCVLVFGVSFGRLLPVAEARNGELFVNHVRVFQLRTGEGQATAQVRAERAAAVIAKHGLSGAVVSRLQNGASVIFVGNTAVLSVSRAEAQAQASDLAALGELWAKRIQEAINLPPFVLSQTEVRVPVGGKTDVAMTGAGTHLVKATPANSGVVKVQPASGRLILEGVSAGESTVEIRYGDTVATLKVTALPVAARFPQQVTAFVMGDPATADVVADAVRSALANRTDTVGRARVEAGSVNGYALGLGETRTYAVPVTVTAPGHFSGAGTVQVTVANIGTKRKSEELLWYSNNPENLLETGPLYWGRLESDVPVRLLSHHYNKTSRPMAVQYFLVNPSEEEARVAVVMGDAVPGKDPTRVGYQAGDLFFRAWLRGSAEVLVVPPRSSMMLINRRLAPLDTMSALGTLRLLPDSSTASELVVFAEARWASDIPAEWRPVVDLGRPWHTLTPVSLDSFDRPYEGSLKEVYLQPYKQVQFQYDHGGRFAFIRIGQEPIAAVDGGAPLLGNFGVQYVIEGVLRNPTNTPQKVEIVFEASAGYSGALFLVDGRYVDARLLQTKQQFVLLEGTLAPGQERRVSIQTIPLSGAHYPATITVRPPGME